MLVTDNYALHPGCCLICRGSVGPAVDTLIDYDGTTTDRIYFCQTCVFELGALFDCLDPVSAERLREELADKSALLETAENERDIQMELNDKMIAAHYDKPNRNRARTKRPPKAPESDAA